MAIQILGQDGASVVAVDPTFDAMRVSLRPAEVVAWQSLGAKSGNATTVAANGSIFSLRNISANLLLVRRVGVGFVLTTAFTTAQILGGFLNKLGGIAEAHPVAPLGNGGAINLDITLEIGEDEVTRLFLNGAETNDGQKAVVRIVKKARNFREL